jgi:ABC-2 type transport system permease protein
MTETLHNTRTIVSKELRSYFDGAAIYIVTVVFLLLWEFLFFREAFLIQEASISSLWSTLPYLFLVLIPAITMGSVSQEKSEGTLEYLLTHPITDAEFLIGKFLAALGFVAGVLLFCFPIAWSFSRHGTLDWGVVVGQYFAAVGMGAVVIALGILISTFMRSQISALLVSATAAFLLMSAGQELVTERMPLSLAPFFAQLSVLTHFNSMARGVIDLRDIWYFISIVAVFLGFAYLLLLRRRYGGRKALYARYQIGVALFIGVAVLTNIVGSRIPGRIDLTRNNLYSLSPATRDTISNLDDVVNVTLYASEELPAQLQPVLRDVKDMLRDYDSLGHGNIVYKIKKPKGNDDIAEQAQSKGVEQVQFNVVGDEEFKVKKGFLGIALSSSGNKESIPFIQDPTTLEYQLTSDITAMTTDTKKKIGFLSGEGEKTPADYQALSDQLGKQFEVATVTIEGKKKSIPKDTAALIVAGPKDKMKAPTRKALKRYIADGGSVLFMLDAVQIDQQALKSTANTNSLGDFIDPFGVELQTDLVYDLRANLTANFGTFVMPYPFWVRMKVNSNHPSTRGFETMTMPWVSSLIVDKAAAKKQGYKVTELIHTTETGGSQTGETTIHPQQLQLSNQNLGEQTAAVALTATKPVKNKVSRIIVIGDSDFVSNAYTQQQQGNREAVEPVAFMLQALSWMAQEGSLASIQVKGGATHKLHFESKSGPSHVKYTNMALALLLPIAIGAFRLLRRRRLSAYTYSTQRKVR